MTGFGRAQKKNALGEIVIEIQSLNRKNFEANIHLPWELSSFENLIRKTISEKVLRGFVQCKVFFYIRLLPEDALPSVELLKQLKLKWQTLAKQLCLDPDQIDLFFLSQQVKNFSKSEARINPEKIKKLLMECLKKSLYELDHMRKKEGEFLQKELLKQLSQLKIAFQKIQKLYPKSLKDYREKLGKKIENLSIEEAIKKEVLNYAEKIDITEEIVRFTSHLEQYDQILKDLEPLKGRKMEFLLQEMFREMNTICSKSIEGNIVSLAVESKSILEKIREQVLNIQ